MVVEALQGFWVQLAPILLQMVYRAKDIVISPILHPELLWILIPVYANWILGDFMSTKTEFSNAAVTGFTYLWVGTSWLREYFQQLAVGLTVLNDNISINISRFLAVANPVELAVVLSMFLYGLVVMWFAVRGKEISKIMGDIRTEAFLLIVITPILFRFITFDIVTITAIVFLALIFYTVIEVIFRIIHPEPAEKNKN